MVSELWPGGPAFKEEDDVHRVGADSVLLADFAAGARAANKRLAADLGCGSGIISVLLALNDPSLHIDAIEIRPRAAVLAGENAALSGLSNRVKIVEGDLRRHRDFLQSGAYDFAVSNPPYNHSGSGARHANSGLAAARDDELCTLGDLCLTAKYLIRWGGSFFLVHKPERLAVIFGALSANGFEPKRLRFVQHNASSPPNLVLVESLRGGKPSLNVGAPLILTNEDGSESDEVKRIYRRHSVEY